MNLTTVDLTRIISLATQKHQLLSWVRFQVELLSSTFLQIIISWFSISHDNFQFRKILVILDACDQLALWTKFLLDVYIKAMELYS